MLMYYDCGNCARRETCESREDGTFCSEWCSTLPDETKKDPDPGGWGPED